MKPIAKSTNARIACLQHLNPEQNISNNDLPKNLARIINHCFKQLLVSKLLDKKTCLNFWKLLVKVIIQYIIGE